MAERTLVLGHATVDTVHLVGGREGSLPDHERAGGKAFNQAVAAARLGCTTALVTATGVDHKAETIERALHKAGVSKRWIVNRHHRWPDQTTVEVTVVEDPFGERLVEVYEDGRLIESYITAIQRVRASLASPDVVISTLELPSPAVAQINEYLRGVRSQHKCVVVVNAAPESALRRPSHAVTELLRHADVVTANEVEAALLAPEDQGPADRKFIAERLYQRLGGPEVYVTLGAHGAAWCTSSGSGEVDAPRVTATDTVGASDVLTAAVALGRAAGAGPSQALALGSLAAGVYIEQKGGAGVAPRPKDLVKRLDILSPGAGLAAEAALGRLVEWLR